MYQSPERIRHDDGNVRDAVRFGLGVVAVGVAFLVTAAVWLSTCSGATADTVACGVPQRTALAVGAPVILFLGGLSAFARAYRMRRRNETWGVWHVVGWLLMTLMLLALALGMPGLAGPAIFAG